MITTLNINKQTVRKSKIQIKMKSQQTNLEILKASVLALKERYLSQAVSENKFAAQNKEYVIGLLKSIA
jgi:hypothetical protein